MVKLLLILGAVAALVPLTPAAAQVGRVDPNSAIDADLNRSRTPATPPPAAPDPANAAPATDNPWQPVDPEPIAATGPDTDPAAPAQRDTGADTGTATARAAPATPAGARGTFGRDDLIGAAEGVFGRGAQGLAKLIEDILRDQGEPNAYITGREAAGAFVIGLRYGSGTMIHRIEGQRPIYWTGPSLGFDVGGDATKVFVLVYNLFDSQDVYKRFAQAEGRAYFVGGFSATYLRRGDVVLIPVRLGVGWRLGANVGYMKFSESSRWFPF